MSVPVTTSPAKVETFTERKKSNQETSKSPDQMNRRNRRGFNRKNQSMAVPNQKDEPQELEDTKKNE